MRAAILETLNSPLEIRDVELTDLKVGQVLVKNIISGLCGAQLQEISGYKGNGNFLPHLLGHEGCGTVVDIGVGVTTVKAGDRVIMHWRKGEGIEAPFPTYILDGKKISSGKVTTLSEYSIVSENRVTKVPDKTEPYLCALLGCGLSTALGIIDNECDLKFGESVMVLGCGGVGLNLIQAARMASAYPVIGVDCYETKRELVNKQIPNFINTKNDNIDSYLKNIGIKNIDVIIDTTGNHMLISECMNLLSENGRFIMVGQPIPGRDVVINNASNMFLGNGRILKATQGGKTNPTIDFPRYVRLYEYKHSDILNVVTHELALDDINRAIDILRSGESGRIMIKI